MTHPAAPGRERLILWALLVLLSAAPLSAASRYDPRLRFRTIATPRFDVHFHQGEAALARRLALVAEDVATRLDQTLGPASGRVQVVLVNQDDLPNGWATPVPYNLIEIAAAGPGGASVLGNTDDWLRLVFTHEYTHIVHLGRSKGWIHGLQRAFGRNPALFPNLTLPLWSIEGTATFEESAETGRGRVLAGDFRQIVTRAATAERFASIDRASGGLDEWPAGNAQYAYGSLFNQFLADTYGPAALRTLTDETARRLPYFGFRAYRRVFGRSLGELWKDFEHDARQRDVSSPAAATRLTHHGFNVSGPRIAADGQTYYSIVNQDDFPALMSIPASGGEPREVTSRFLGNQVAPTSGGVLVFDQLERAANVGLQSDLYTITTRGDRPIRLTHGWRAADPDVSPDGTTAAFTVQRADRRDLVTAPLRLSSQPGLGAATVIASSPETEFTAPRWSPDGRTIAVERHVRGALAEIVVVDIVTHAITAVVSSSRARSVSPAWMPDGRRLLYASNPPGAPFRVFAIDLATGRAERLEGTGASAESPAVSPDGRSVTFVGYTPDGYDLYRLPLTDAHWTAVDGDAADAPPTPQPLADDVPADRADRAYAPWRTLAPRFWTPIVGGDDGEAALGAAISGGDALGRHNYSADVLVSSGQARPDWALSYVYDRWWPTLFVSVSDDTGSFRDGETRSTEVNAGLLLPWRRVRWTQSLLAGLHGSVDTVDCASCEVPDRPRTVRRAMREGYAFTSVRTYGFSISPEQGWSLTATNEVVARGLGSDGNAASLVADLRTYRRAWPRHGVVAGRIAGATSWGDESARRSFSASGGGPQSGGFRFESDAIALVRGFEDDARGWHALTANADYRFPLVRVQRGFGTWPAFVRSVHGALFVDAGHSWNATFRARDARVSFGAELSADTVLGYALPVTVTAGVAVRRDGAGDQDGPAWFGRVGRAF